MALSLLNPTSNVSVQASGDAYIDISPIISNLTAKAYYLFGAYSEEDGASFVYLLNYQGSGVLFGCLALPRRMRVILTRSRKAILPRPASMP
jgi:hypothetical protein